MIEDRRELVNPSSIVLACWLIRPTTRSCLAQGTYILVYKLLVLPQTKQTVRIYVETYRRHHYGAKGLMFILPHCPCSIQSKLPPNNFFAKRAFTVLPALVSSASVLQRSDVASMVHFLRHIISVTV